MGPIFDPMSSMKQCEVTGCGESRKGYSTLCDRHKRIKRRHGHPDQDGITVADLKPYRKRVKTRMTKNKGSNAWGILRERWSRITSMAPGTEPPTPRALCWWPP